MANFKFQRQNPLLLLIALSALVAVVQGDFISVSADLLANAWQSSAANVDNKIACLHNSIKENSTTTTTDLPYFQTTTSADNKLHWLLIEFKKSIFIRSVRISKTSVYIAENLDIAKLLSSNKENHCTAKIDQLHIDKMFQPCNLNTDLSYEDIITCNDTLNTRYMLLYRSAAGANTIMSMDHLYLNGFRLLSPEIYTNSSSNFTLKENSRISIGAKFYTLNSERAQWKLKCFLESSNSFTNSSNLNFTETTQQMTNKITMLKVQSVITATQQLDGMKIVCQINELGNQTEHFIEEKIMVWRQPKATLQPTRLYSNKAVTITIKINKSTLSPNCTCCAFNSGSSCVRYLTVNKRPMDTTSQSLTFTAKYSPFDSDTRVRCVVASWYKNYHGDKVLLYLNRFDRIVYRPAKNKIVDFDPTMSAGSVKQFQLISIGGEPNPNHICRIDGKSMCSHLVTKNSTHLITQFAIDVKDGKRQNRLSCSFYQDPQLREEKSVQLQYLKPAKAAKTSKFLFGSVVAIGILAVLAVITTSAKAYRYFTVIPVKDAQQVEENKVPHTAMPRKSVSFKRSMKEGKHKTEREEPKHKTLTIIYNQPVKVAISKNDGEDGKAVEGEALGIETGTQ